MNIIESSQSSLPYGQLRIMATSDVHMHLTSWDSRIDKRAPGTGLDQLATTINQARRAATGATILLDNGDTLQGTPEGDVAARGLENAQHPWAAISKALAYDAGGLGNHDFDFGKPFLEQVVDQIEMPVLCSSLSSGRINGVQSTALISRKIDCDDGHKRPISIGVFSVLPPQTVYWCHHQLANHITLQSGPEAAMDAITQLRGQGADIIIALCHSGPSNDTEPGSENFATLLARHVHGIDAMVMGHTHQRFPDPAYGPEVWADPVKGTIADIPAVMPGVAAQSLGVIDLKLMWENDAWQVSGHSVSLLSANLRTADPEISALAAPTLAATSTVMDNALTTTNQNINSFFAGLRTGADSHLMARAMTRVISDTVAGTSLASLPLIAAVASASVGGIGGPNNFVHVPSGVVQERHLKMICPHHDSIFAVVLTGADLRNWAERAAVIFAPTQGILSPLINANAPFFNFDALIGLQTEINPFVPARFDVNGKVVDPNAARIVSLTHSGVEVRADDRFLVAVTSYRGSGGGKFPGLNTAEEIVRTKADLHSAIRDVCAAGPITIGHPESAWRFANVTGQEVTIDTSPAAKGQLSDIAAFHPRPMGLTDDGFLRLRVSL